jgi:hypothetical protein
LRHPALARSIPSIASNGVQAPARQCWIAHRCVFPRRRPTGPMHHAQKHTETIHSCDTYMDDAILSLPVLAAVCRHTEDFAVENPILGTAGHRPCLVPWTDRDHRRITTASPSGPAPRQPMLVVQSTALGCTTKAKGGMASSLPRWITPAAVNDDEHNSPMPKAPDICRRALSTQPNRAGFRPSSLWRGRTDPRHARQR